MGQTQKRKLLKSALLILFLGGVFFVFKHFNPSQHSFFIPCPFNFATGYHCPGCGSQRAIHQLLHFNIIGALKLNPLLVLSLPIIVYGLGIQVWNYIFETNIRFKLFYSTIFIYGYFGFVLLYWVLRNLPYYPYNLLAPSD